MGADCVCAVLTCVITVLCVGPCGHTSKPSENGVRITSNASNNRARITANPSSERMKPESRAAADCACGVVTLQDVELVEILLVVAGRDAALLSSQAVCQKKDLPRLASSQASGQIACVLTWARITKPVI